LKQFRALVHFGGNEELTEVSPFKNVLKGSIREALHVILGIFWQQLLPISWQRLDARSGLTLPS
jgi:hypothetical protein